MGQRICSVQGCESKVLARTWCPKHYNRWRVHGSPTAGGALRPKPASAVCSVDGCDRQHKGHGYCDMHLKRWRLYGDPLSILVEQHAGGASGICSIPDCTNPAFAKTWCRSHHARWKRGGDPTRDLKRPRTTRGESHNRNGLRLCTACGTWKPEGAYYQSASRSRDTQCKACQNERVAEQRASDPESFRIRSRAFYASRPGYAAAKSAKWALENPERHRAERRRAAIRRYYRKLNAWIEDVDREKVFARDGGVCGICGLDVPADLFEMDHVVPVSRGGKHCYANVQVAHRTCNRWKSTKLLSELPARPTWMLGA